MVGITIVYTGLIPSEISALGIKFGAADQNALLYILAIIIFYFLIAFVVYAASDFLAWRSAIRQHYEELGEKRRGRESQRDDEWFQLRKEMRKEIESRIEEMKKEIEPRIEDLRKHKTEEFEEKALEEMEEELQRYSLEEVRAQIHRLGQTFLQREIIRKQPGSRAELEQKYVRLRMLGTAKATEAAGTVEWLALQGKEAAARDIDSAVTEHVERWASSYEAEQQSSLMAYLMNPVILIRAIFEFILPLGVGAFAITVLVT